MCKLTLRNHTHKRFKRKWVNQQEKKKLITYGKWSYSNNNFSEEVHTLLEFCSTFKNTLLLWLLLWTSKVTNNLYNNSFVPEYLTYFSLHICVYITTPLRRKATLEHGLVWEYSEASAPKSLFQYHPSDALSLRLMEESPHKTKATTVSVHWCSFGIQGRGTVSAELPLCPREAIIWEEGLNYRHGHWCWLCCCFSAS